MTWINLSDVEAQLRGLRLVLDKPLTFDARIQRWKVEGEDNERRGWSRLKEWTSPRTGARYIVGDFGVWHGTDDGRQRIELPKRDDPQRPPVSAEDLAAIKAAQKEAAKKLAETRKAEAKTAARWASAVWTHCTPAPADHDYLARKGVAAHGLRLLAGPTDAIPLKGLDDSNLYRLKAAAQEPGALVVPMHDEQGNVVGLQFVYGKGHARRAKLERDKEFWPSGMAMGGSFGLIGPLRREGVLLIAEGFATAATLAEATGHTVAYAFSANNLIKAGRALRKTCPRARLLFCADDDYLTEGNPGTAFAAQAAAEIEHSAWTAPRFADESGNDLRNGKKLTDYNDLAALTSRLQVAAQINAALDELGWRENPLAGASAGGSPNVGGGEGGLLPARLSIDEAAARYSLIYGGKGTLFDHVEHMLVPKGDVLDILPPRAWDMLKMHPLWQPRRLSEVGFDPTGRDARISCNLWGGWPTTPVPGKCEALLALLLHLCSREKNASEVYQFALKWLALPIQQPGAKLATALVFHGPQGQGKNLFFEAVMAIYGEYGRIIDQAAIEDKFNDWASRKLFMIADEVVARAELFHLKNKLKGFITGEWVRINPKNVAAHDERNHVNLVFLSNEDMPLHVEIGDRRYTVVRTPSELPAALVEAVKAEIAAGGIAALHHHLATLPLGDFHAHSKPPMTEAKRDLIEYGMGSVDRFARDWCRGEVEIAGKPLPFGPVGSAQIYKAYALWCRGQGELRPRPQNQFAGSLGNLPGWEKGFKDRFDNFNSSETKRWRCLLPSPGAMAAAKLLRLEPDLSKTDAETQTDWLTRCFFAFEQALEERP